MSEIILAYGASVDLAVTLASLPTSSTLLVGRQTPLIDNSTDGWPDFQIAGKITTGTTPTAGKEICIHVWSLINDAPTYPDTFGATDAARTLTSAEIKDIATHRVIRIATDATSDRAYGFSIRSLAAILGGLPFKKGGLWITHNTGVDLNSTAGNHVISITPVKHQIV